MENKVMEVAPGVFKSVFTSDGGFPYPSGRDDRGITGSYESAISNEGDGCGRIITGTLHASKINKH